MSNVRSNNHFLIIVRYVNGKDRRTQCTDDSKEEETQFIHSLQQRLLVLLYITNMFL